MSDPQNPDLGALSRVFAVINGKGGVLKTSLAANVGALLAAAGWKVLEIDLDVSGNLKLDFGLTDEDEDDMGRGLVETIWYGEKGLPVVKGVRTNLDFVFGGRGLEQLGSLARSSMVDDLPTGSLAGEFARALSEVADDYDLILLDCPPGNSEIQDMALAVARWVLIPTRTDQASLDGLRTVGPRVKRARRTNPELRYAGVVVTAHNPSATRVLREVRSMLSQLGDTVPLMETTIRHSQTAAFDCRARGQLAHELARDAESTKSSRLQVLSARRRSPGGADNVVELPTALSGTANSLADDYRHLAKEIRELITRTETASASTGRDAR
jgi:cellulose biosynthesis protein BcsQ